MMALPRAAVLAIIGGVLIVAAFVATRGAGEGDDVEPTPTVAVQSGQAQSSGAGSQAPAKPRSKPEPKPSASTKPASAAPAKAKPAPAKPKQPARRQRTRPSGPIAPAGIPMPVVRALAARKVAVLYFTQSAADDDATSRAVRAVEGTAGVAVFSESIDRVSRYRRLVEGLGISQAPSIVIVGRDLDARLLEGYIDTDSLRQHVADAR